MTSQLPSHLTQRSCTWHSCPCTLLFPSPSLSAQRYPALPMSPTLGVSSTQCFTLVISGTSRAQPGQVPWCQHRRRSVSYQAHPEQHPWFGGNSSRCFGKRWKNPQRFHNFPPKTLHRVGKFLSPPPPVIACDVLSLSGERIWWMLLNHTHMGKIKTHPGTILLYSERGEFHWMGSGPMQCINTDKW